MLFANKKFLVEVERAESDGYIDYGETVQPYYAGNMILTDQDGNQSVVTESSFYNDYQAVRKLHKDRTKQQSPFELAYTEQLANFSLDSSIESDEYISGTRELMKNKSF